MKEGLRCLQSFKVYRNLFYTNKGLFFSLFTMKAPVGFLATLTFVFFVELVTFTNGYYHLWKHERVWGIVMLLLQLVFSSLMLSSLVICAIVNPGNLPNGLIATNVHSFTREELEKYASIDPAAENQDEPERETKNQLSIPVDDETINANELAAERAQARIEAAEDTTVSEGEEKEVYVGTEADHPAAIEERRQRKIRLGLAVVSLPEVARNILRGFDEGGDRKREELEKLFDKVKLCPYCQVYQLERTYHCEACNRCVPHCSHHCCSISQCVGSTNHKAYILFIFYTILAALDAVITDVWVTSKGWNYFLTIDSINLPFYIAYNSCTVAAVVLTLYILTHLHTVGCGESMIINLKRQEQEARQSNRRRTAHGTFEELPQEDILPPRKGFQWSNVRDLFGNERTMLRYFLPFFEPKLPSNLDQNIHADLRELISMRLHSLADVVPEEPIPE